MEEESELRSRTRRRFNPEVSNIQEPDLPPNIYDRMRNLYDKLTMLDYQEACPKLTKIRPIHRFYFATQINPGEQFYNFSVVASWLIRKCGLHVDLPQETDDPNKIIRSILDNVTILGGEYVQVSKPKLMSGYGHDVLVILEYLVSVSFKKQRISFRPPVIPIESDTEEEEEAEDQVITLEKVEEELEVFEDSDDDVVCEEKGHGWMLAQLESQFQIGQDEEMLKSDTDAEAWQYELESVLPKLKVVIPKGGGDAYDPSDWRSRMRMFKEHAKEVDQACRDVVPPINDLVAKLGDYEERLWSRHRVFNTRFGDFLHEYKAYESVLRNYRGVLEDGRKTHREYIRIYEQVSREVEEECRGIKEWSELEERTGNLADVKMMIRMLKEDLNKVSRDATLTNIIIHRHRETNRSQYYLSKKFRGFYKCPPTVLNGVHGQK